MNTIANLIPRGLVALLLAFAVAVAPALAVPPGGDRVTIAIECSDGVVDSDWKIELEILGPDGKPKGTITQLVPKHTTSKAAAEGIKEQLLRDFECESTTEKTNDKYWKTQPEVQSRDLVIPAGCSIGKVKTFTLEGGNWQPKKGHLKVLRGGEQINNKRSRMGSTSGKAAEDADEPTYFEGLEISVEPFDFDTLEVDLNLWGPGDGGEVRLRYHATFPVGTTDSEVIFDLGQWALDQGFTVLYEDGNKVHIDLRTGSLPVEAWSFNASFEGGGPDDHDDTLDRLPLQAHGVTFSARAH